MTSWQQQIDKTVSILEDTPTHRKGEDPYNPIELDVNSYCRLTCGIRQTLLPRDEIPPNEWSIYKMRMEFDIIGLDGCNTHQVAYILGPHNIRTPVHYVPFYYRNLPVYIFK